MQRLGACPVLQLLPLSLLVQLVLLGSLKYGTGFPLRTPPMGLQWGRKAPKCIH